MVSNPQDPVSASIVVRRMDKFFPGICIAGQQYAFVHSEMESEILQFAFGIYVKLEKELFEGLFKPRDVVLHNQVTC